jgi:hypothetical protein
MVLIYRQALRILDVVETEEAGQALEKLLLNSVMMAFRNRIWLYEISEKSPEQIVEDIFFGLRGAKKKTMELKTL